MLNSDWVCPTGELSTMLFDESKFENSIVRVAVERMLIPTPPMPPFCSNRLFDNQRCADELSAHQRLEKAREPAVIHESCGPDDVHRRQQQASRNQRRCGQADNRAVMIDSICAATTQMTTTVTAAAVNSHHLPRVL